MTLIIERTQKAVDDLWCPKEKIGKTNDKERGARFKEGFGSFVLAPPNTNNEATGTSQHAGGEEVEGDAFYTPDITGWLAEK